MSVTRWPVCFGAWIAALTVAFYELPEFSMYTWAAIGLSSSVAVLMGVRLNRPERRLPWFLLAGMLASFTLGDTMYNILTDFLGQTNPFPSLAEVFYLPVYPLLATALLIFVRARAGGDNRAALLDALLPTAGLGLLSWVFMIAPYVRDGGLDLGEKLVSVAYPLGDILALAMLLRLLTAPGRRSLSTTVLAVGVTCLLVTDVVYGLRQLNGTWAVGGPTDVGWVLFYTALGVSALHPSMRGLATPSASGPIPGAAGGRRIAVMSIAALIAPAVLLEEDLTGEVRDAPMIATACAMMFLLVMARVAGLVDTQRRAGARERTLRQAGAMLVAATTEADAAETLHRAVAELLPPGEPHRFHLVAVDTTSADTDTGADTSPDNGLGLDSTDLGRIAAIVPVEELPAEISEHLAGFAMALHTELLGTQRQDSGSNRRWQAYLATAPATLHLLRQSFDALMAQGAMAIERINLTMEISRRDGEDYFRALIQSAADVILIVDDDNRIKYASPSTDTVFGHSDRVGTPVTGLFDSADHAAFDELLTQVRQGHGHHDGLDLCATRADHQLLQVECGCRDLRDDPAVAGLVLTIRDVTERRRLERDLAHQAFHDALTGLANRVLFLNRLEHAAMLAQRSGTLIGVLFIDLDDFKELNDTLGHAVGDRLLVNVGQRITEVIGPLNTAARMGGDEFAVLIEQIDSPDDADVIAARIVAALAVPVEVSDGTGGTHVINGAVSVGVATSQEEYDTTELQRHADIALYSAKSMGKNTWERYVSYLHAAMVERLELRSALNEVVAGDQLFLRYQPIVTLATGTVIGFEALVRWQHPTRGLLGPDQFIELAEENGAIVMIGDWVLRKALQAFVEWRRIGAHTINYISVNVSARQFRTPGFVDQVRLALAETGADPQWLLLEITESLVLRDADQVWADLRALRALGIRIAIDDFGTGYSSLSYLRQMPVDVLKIDKSFIDDILHSDQQRALVEAIVSLARTLDLAVVAEGIEQVEHHETLARMGCPLGQGYLFSPPVLAADVTRWLHADAFVA